MVVTQHHVAPVGPWRSGRRTDVDNLKVLLVVGVIVAHATMAWTANDAWVLEEPTVREPLLTLLNLAALTGVMFAIPLFLVIAGSFTPQSLARKGPRRFVIDRMIRLGVPLLFYLVVFAPIVEYVDAHENSALSEGFWSYAPQVWLHPAPGPLWFLEVLLVLSVIYTAVRVRWPAGERETSELPGRQLIAFGAAIALAAYLVRLGVAFDREVGQDLYLGGAPAWVGAFGLGVVGAERGWFDRFSPAMSRRLFRAAWSAVAATVVVVSVVAGAMGRDIDVFFGGGTWQSAALAMLQGVLVVAMSLWLIDVFRRRAAHQGRLGRELGRAAFAAYIVHQVVLVGTVLATRRIAGPPELDFLLAATAAVVGSFAIGALVTRVRGVARVV